MRRILIIITLLLCISCAHDPYATCTSPVDEDNPNSQPMWIYYGSLNTCLNAMYHEEMLRRDSWNTVTNSLNQSHQDMQLNQIHNDIVNEGIYRRLGN